MNPAEYAVSLLCKIEAKFPNGKQVSGSGFSSDLKGEIITCNHVVFDNGEEATDVKVNGKNARIKNRYPDIDVAVLDFDIETTAQFETNPNINVGDQLYFAGYPSGVRVASAFFGIVSAMGENLISNPNCQVIQINGMVNSGNSGGPVVNSSGSVVGIITAKYVPLLLEVDKLLKILKELPQYPSEVGLGQIDFAKFVNMMIASLTVISGSLRLVQVGTGYAVPVRLLIERR